MKPRVLLVEDSPDGFIPDVVLLDVMIPGGGDKERLLESGFDGYKGGLRHA